MEFQAGDIVELPIYANVIPPGRYKFVEEDDEIIILSVAKDIVIGLAKAFWRPFLKKVKEDQAVPTSTWAFLRNYARARATIAGGHDARNPAKVTFCMMSPRYGRI
jgi:hypothetical protein